jgi:formylglycine-generating enzyme required for sulfatase activity
MKNLLQTLIVALSAFVFMSCSDATGPSEGFLEGMRFVTVSSGSCQVGAPESEEGSQATERPVHDVTFDYSFEIMTTEVTQGMWEEVMGDNPSQGCGVGSKYPVYNVSWNDCQDFITELDLLDPDYTYRLPSEAEWEYACRRTTTTRFYWGNDLGTVSIDYNAWFEMNSAASSHEVEGKNENAWGLFDISGNVYEWCQDYYHYSYVGAPTDGSAWLEPATSDRVIRGGCWSSPKNGCRSAYRDAASPDHSSAEIGFRLVRERN